MGTRARIILAGPLANLLLPVVIFWGVFAIVGQPYFLPVMGTPDPGSPAALAGLLPGDRVQALNGVRIERWTDVEVAVQASAGKPLDFIVVRDGRTFDVRLAPRTLVTQDIFGQDTQTWDLGLHPLLSTRIGQVLPGHVAEQAGVKSGDRIIALNGTPVVEWEQLAKTIHESPGKPVRLTVDRAGQRIEVEVTPRPTKQQTGASQEEIGLIGIGPASDSHYQRLDPVNALIDGVKETARLSVVIVEGFVKLIQGRISPKTIGGPILITQMAGEVVQRGVVQLLSFTALLSINLAILNLLPIPILDGGHLLFSLIEWLRGKPISLRKREIAQQVGMVLLVGLMIFAFYNDIFRLLGRQ